MKFANIRRAPAAAIVGLGLTAGLIVGSASLSVAAGSPADNGVPNGSITSADIANETIRSWDIADGTIQSKDLTTNLKSWIKGQAGEDGTDGVDGADGRDGLDGAVYRVLTYKNGGGGSATVACADDNTESQKYVAISGGVQGSTVANQSADGFAVTSSFPGRMDWSTGEPKADRLDGWIVLGNSQYTDTLTVWALCVPTDAVEVQRATIDN